MRVWGLWLAVFSGTCIPLALPFLLSQKALAGGIVFLSLVLAACYRIQYKKLFVIPNQTIPLLICLIVSCCTMEWVTFRIQDRLEHRWPEAEAGHAITLEGWVDDLPRLADYGVRFSFRITGQNETGSVKNFPERVWLTSYFPVSEKSPKWIPQAGQCWRISVKLKSPHGLMNPHTFDVESWMFSHGLDATGALLTKISPQSLEQCSAGFMDQPMQRLQQLRQYFKNHIISQLGTGLYAGVITALVIGDQAAIPDVQWQRFNASGIGHLISISGFHITFLAGIVAWGVKRIIRFSPRCMDWAPDHLWKAVSGLLIAAAYVILAGGGVPAQRTALMMAVMTLGWTLGQSAERVALFAWSTIGVLLLDSFAPLAAGFWLSFMGVGALMLSGSGRLPTYKARRFEGVRQAVHSQWVATLVLAPMTLYLFGQVSLAGILANALAIPAISFVITPLALFGTLFAGCPGTVQSLKAAHDLFEYLDHVLQFLVSGALFPAVLKGAQPSLLATIAATLGLLYFCALQAFPLRWWIGGLSLLPLWILPNKPVLTGAVRATVLDVGQGLSVLIETAHHRLLYDAGPRPFRATPESQVDAGARVILPFFHGEGIENIDTLLISHHDLDHRGGADTLLAQLPVRTLLTSDNEHAFPTRKANTVYQSCIAGQQWEWDGVHFVMLSPSAERSATEQKPNDRSCVLKVSTAESSLLLPGDAEINVENELVARIPQALAASVLIAGHHGSKSSSSTEWLALIQPTYTVFTSGYLNHYHHPHPTVVKRIEESGSVTFRSDHDGAVQFELPEKGDHIQVSAWRKQHTKVWFSY